MKENIIDKAWSIKHEKHLNPNNIIFQDSKYLRIYNDMKEVDDSIGWHEDRELYSTCCTAKPLGNIHEFDGEHFGNCGDCKEHTDFEKEELCP
jgi:hypothetical protein